MYKKVNDMLGDIVKVTPSSKMVGDLAIFMVQNDLTPENIVEKGAGSELSLTRVVSYFKGMMGQPAWRLPQGSAEGRPEGQEAHHLPSRRAAAARWTSRQAEGACWQFCGYEPI